MTMRNYKLDKLSKRVQDLFKDPPTFQEFATKWETMDELSRSLYELSLVSPELSGKPRNYERISEYLRRLGVNPEPINVKTLVESLESDV